VRQCRRLSRCHLVARNKENGTREGRFGQERPSFATSSSFRTRSETQCAAVIAIRSESGEGVRAVGIVAAKAHRAFAPSSSDSTLAA
jgi:hypothetical protein